MFDSVVQHAELRKRFCVLCIEQKGDQWEPCSTTRGPDAVAQEHQQSERASQGRRECAATRTRMHSHRDLLRLEARGGQIVCFVLLPRNSPERQPCGHSKREMWIHSQSVF
ncbi:hypothetical protein F2P79_008889 [Pimephales promelas]|nr:hypothetical protein F2P79_008889 [Pimephales promelas]